MRTKHFKITLCLMLCFTLILGGCGTKKTDEELITLNIAYQYGLAYAPLAICQEKNLIEEEYKELTGKEVTVVWNQMSSGPDINTGIASNSLDVGFMGIAPAITGISKNVGYKIFTNLSGQEHGLMTNDPSINSFDDIIGTDKQIALVNIGSIQHIILAKTLYDNGYDPHCLDSNIVAMKHPDGMSSLETNSISCHLTSNPYLYMERDNESLSEISLVSDSWDRDNSFIVGVCSQSLYEDNPELYTALRNAISKAIDYINENPEEAAQITATYNGNELEKEIEYLQYGSYSTSTKGIFELSQFMYNNEFIESEFSSYSDLVFDGVTGD